MRTLRKSKWPHIFLEQVDFGEFQKFTGYDRRDGDDYTEYPEGRRKRRVSYEAMIRNLLQERVESDPEFAKKNPQVVLALKDRKVMRQIARAAAAADKERWKKESEEYAKLTKKVLKEFDASVIKGPDDWIYRQSFKTALRKVLVEYLADYNGNFSIKRSGKFSREFLAEALEWKAERTLGFLKTLAERDDGFAMQVLASCAIPMIKIVNEKALERADCLGELPERLPAWPVLKSPHSDFDQDHRKLLRLLQVGKKYPLLIAEGARWTAKDAIGKWAVHLLQDIEIQSDGRFIPPDAKPWLKKLEKLQAFSAQTWKEWWEVAAGMLRDEYDVLKIPELVETVRSPADRKSEGRIRKRIFQAFKEKFKSMAGQNKV